MLFTLKMSLIYYCKLKFVSTIKMKLYSLNLAMIATCTSVCLFM